jgi:hypothetical protein
LVGLILSLGIAVLGFGNHWLVPVVHFNLTIPHVFLNRRCLQVVHGLFQVSHRLLILLEVNHEIVGPLPLQYPPAQVLHVVRACRHLLIDQAVNELELRLNLSLLILQGLEDALFGRLCRLRAPLLQVFLRRGGLDPANADAPLYLVEVLFPNAVATVKADHRVVPAWLGTRLVQILSHLLLASLDLFGTWMLYQDASPSCC